MPGSRGRRGSGGRDRGLPAGKRGANRSIGSEAGWDGLECSGLSLAAGPPPPSGRAGRGGPGGVWAQAPGNQPRAPTAFIVISLGRFIFFLLLNFLSRSTISGKCGPGASVAACGGPRPGGAHLWSGSSVVPSASVKEMRHGSGLGSAGVTAPAPGALGGSLIPVPWPSASCERN